MSSWCSKCDFQECGPLGVHKCYCGHFRRDHVSDEPSNAKKRAVPPSAAQLEANRGTVLSLEDLKKNTSPESGADQGICPTCNKILGWEAVLIVSGIRVHKACGNGKICAKCKGAVGGAYVGSGGQYFHKECAGLTGICPGCNQTLFGQMVTVAGKKYHSACLNCAGCKKNVVNGFLQRGELVYCEPCYEPFLETTVETVTVEGDSDESTMGKFEEKYNKWTSVLFGGGQPSASAGAGASSKWAIKGGGKEKDKEKEKDEAKEKEKKAREVEMKEKMNKDREAKEKLLKIEKEKSEKEKMEKAQKEKADKEAKSTTKQLPSSPLSPSLRPHATPSLPPSLTPLSPSLRPHATPSLPPSLTPLSPPLRASPSPSLPSPLSPSLRSAPSPSLPTPLSPSLRPLSSPPPRGAPAATSQRMTLPPLRSDTASPPSVSASPSVPSLPPVRALSPTPASRAPAALEPRAPAKVNESRSLPPKVSSKPASSPSSEPLSPSAAKDKSKALWAGMGTQPPQGETEAAEEDSHADRKVITFRFGEEVKKIRLPPLTVKLIPLHTKLLKAFPVNALALSFLQGGKQVDIVNDEVLLIALTTCDVILCKTKT